MRIFIITLFILFHWQSFSQTIRGTIKDAASSQPLIGANIILENGNGTATDIDGKYIIKTDPGTYNVVFKYIGYKDITKKITLKKEESIVVNINLELNSEQLSTVVVSAGKFEQKIEEITVSMEVIKPSLIENKI